LAHAQGVEGICPAKPQCPAWGFAPVHSLIPGLPTDLPGIYTSRPHRHAQTGPHRWVQPPAGWYSGSDARPVRLRRADRAQNGAHRVEMALRRWLVRPVEVRAELGAHRRSTAPCTRYFQHARLGQQANLPVDGGFRDVGQARAQVRGGEYPPPGDHDGGAAAAVAVSRRGRPPPAAPLARRHPAAVFLAGAARSVWTNWNVQDRAVELTTSVVYDRARTGGATGRELPRTSAQVTDELRELLPAAGVPAPYLLVGHSRRRPAAGRATGHPVLHGDRRVQGSSVGRRYRARHHALPPSRRRRPAQRDLLGG